MRENEDRSLLDSFANGDQQAFRKFYLRHRQGLFLLFRNYCHSEDLAADLMQEFFRLFSRKLDKFRNANNVKQYLYQSARNLALAFLRGDKRYRHLLEKAGKTMDRPQKTPWLEKHDDDNSGESPASVELNQALADLTGEQREVLFLRLYDDFSFAEMEKMLKVPQNTLNKRYHAALTLLRERYGRTFRDDGK